MTGTKYNGWTNYATWRVNLEMWDGFEINEGEFPDISGIADYLQESSVNSIENQSEGLARDYALAFLSEVNWYEIAEHIAENCELFNDESEE